MSLKADVLKLNPNKLKEITKAVSSVLARIDDEIKAAYDRDECKVSVSVPITYKIPYMSNRNAQRAIYHKILESLLDRGFITKIYLTKDQSIFHITWLSDDEQKEIELQNALLAKFTFMNLSEKKDS